MRAKRERGQAAGYGSRVIREGARERGAAAASRAKGNTFLRKSDERRNRNRSGKREGGERMKGGGGKEGEGRGGEG